MLKDVQCSPPRLLEFSDVGLAPGVFDTLSGVGQVLSPKYLEPLLMQWQRTDLLQRQTVTVEVLPQNPWGP